MLTSAAFPDRWVGVFDILGFAAEISNASSDFDFFRILSSYRETLDHLENQCAQYSPGCISYSWFSDTFFLFSAGETGADYAVVQQAAKHFFHTCTYSRVPMRGAVAFGSVHVDLDQKIFIGAAIVEAYRYCEDQDWLGLLLTPTATRRARELGLEPLHHDFVDGHIPLRDCPAEGVLSYKLSSGRASYSSPLLGPLGDMESTAPPAAKPKYQRTAEHLARYYRRIEP